ncbi:hypothetical protein EXS73_01050 [Candidatus Pacearchaeota archaeon]|nr:hypothetical protein [Candidatus Pacearchaeota archaeon]
MGAPPDLAKRYLARLETSQTSNEYKQFKQDVTPELTQYERLAQSLGNILAFKLSPKDELKVSQALKEAHINVTPPQALGLALTGFLGTFLLTTLISTGIFFITSAIPVLFASLGIIAGIFLYYYLSSYPARLAHEWKLAASAEMVPAILYTVIYMKHTSNFERAITFTANNLSGPLAKELQKVIYDVEVGKYSTLKQSLDTYLDSWRIDAPEFIEAFHLIESSLYEPAEARRIQILEKSLQVMLDGVYEKMLKYSREVRAPLTNVYMLGIILPTLGLAMLPLASTLLGGVIQWYHVFLGFNLLIPFVVVYLVNQALLKRPGGYGETTILEQNPAYPQYASNKPWITYSPILFLGLCATLLPFIMQLTFVQQTFGLQAEYTFQELNIPFFENQKLFDFKNVNGAQVGPFSPIATLLGLCFPAALGLYLYFVYRTKTKELIKARDQTKQLEQEFTTSLFQLGNRLGDNVPAEIAFAKVAEVTQNQQTHEFFALVNSNIQQAGMSLEQALFDKRRGAITYFPSNLIASSMRILVESVKKGLQVAAQSLMSISEYIKNVEKINQRLHDLLAEVVSDMRSNMTFLAPLLSGIVVGLSVMITAILNKLEAFKDALPSGQESGFSSILNITDLFKVSEMIPPYFIQLAIGIYILQVIFILTNALVTVDAGKDQLKEKYERAQNIRTGLALYIGTTLLATLTLTILALTVISDL